MRPLADKIRPKNIKDVVGQTHLLGNNKPIYNMIKRKTLTNMVFYGPSGTGKTTVSNILKSVTEKRLYKINATVNSLADVKNIIDESYTLSNSKGIILYIDEIQYFNKKQQQALLDYIETGQITLIASTTENPFFCIFSGILSRCNVFEFKPLTTNDVKRALKRAVEELELINNKKIEVKDSVKTKIAKMCNGDVRKACGFLELLYLSSNNDNENVLIDEDVFYNAGIISNIKYSNGDEKYDLISAFQKSIRGSDVDASLYYLSLLIKGNDLPIIARRLLVIASEDIGLAYPSAISIVLSCVTVAERIGFPEARIPLAQAVIFLASCPKSNSVTNAIDSSLLSLSNGEVFSIPDHLKDNHCEKFSVGDGTVDYKYPHDYDNNYVKQQYLPKELIGTTYYQYGDNKFENNLKQYWEKVK